MSLDLHLVSSSSSSCDLVSLHRPNTFFQTGVFGLSISNAEDGILTFGRRGLDLLSLLGKGFLTSSELLPSLTATSGTPFSTSRTWRFGGCILAVSRRCSALAFFNLLLVSSSCNRFSIGEKVIFLGVSGVVTALTALVTLRADRRRPSLIFHCLFFARKNKTAVVAKQDQSAGYPKRLHRQITYSRARPQG